MRGQLRSDLVALTKPGVLRMCVLTTAGGLWLAPGERSATLVVSALVGSALAVAAANTFNMLLEHEPDRRMARTMDRPLAARRLPLSTAALFGGVLAFLAWTVLIAGTNPLTAALALLAIGAYVLVYTPLKYRTPLALLVGAVPGAVPPLLGFTAVTGELSRGGLAVFCILLVWQMPHFLAIALHRKEDYARAGVRCVPVCRGDAVAKLQAVAWAGVLVPVSALPSVVGLTGGVYLALALPLSLAFWAWSLRGLAATASPQWPRSLFWASLVYLPAVTGALVLDRLLGAGS